MVTKAELGVAPIGEPAFPLRLTVSFPLMIVNPNETFMTPMSKLDAIDLKILDEIQKDGRISIVELARRVNLTKTPCAERLKRLEKTGAILGYHTRLNPEALDIAHVTFVEVQLKSTTADALADFNRAVLKAKEIQACHMVAGGFDYLLKVRTSDIKGYRETLGLVISRLPHVQQTHTYVVMEEVKDDPILPIPKPVR
jgi:Lrp/AsnC family transcriptional regulator, leucine-responsive regulatory protein